MGEFIHCCNAPLTQYIVGHQASIRLEVKWPWSVTVDMVFCSEPSFISWLSMFHLIIAIPLLSAYWDIMTKCT